MSVSCAWEGYRVRESQDTGTEQQKFDGSALTMSRSQIFYPPRENFNAQFGAPIE